MGCLKFKRVIVCNCLMLLCITASGINKPTDGQSTYSLPEDAQHLLDSIKRYECINLAKMQHYIDALEETKNENAKIYVDYYRLKADFYNYGNKSALNEYAAIYDRLKERQLYKLMMEVDLLGSLYYAEIIEPEHVSKYVERALKYSFENNLLIETATLTHGLALLFKVMPLEQQKEYLQLTLDGIRDVRWGVYHSKLHQFLTLIMIRLRDYQGAKKVILNSIENNLKSKNNLELAYNYVLLGDIESEVDTTSSSIIKGHLKSIDYKKIYGAKHLDRNYRAIGKRYMQENKYQEAYEYLKRLSDFKERDSLFISHDFIHTGEAYFKINPQENYKRALGYFDQALSYSSLGDLAYRRAILAKITTLKAVDKEKEAKQYESILEEARSRMESNIKVNIKDFIVSALLRLQQKNHLLKELKEEKILKSEQLKTTWIIGLSLFGFTTSVLIFFYLFNIIKQNKRENKALRKQLSKSLSEINSINLELKTKEAETDRLQDLNNDVLFSKILKTASYKSDLEEIRFSLLELLKRDKQIKSNTLSNIEQDLTSLISEEQIWIELQAGIEKTRPGFFERLKELAPDLSTNDLKQCAFILFKLSANEVAKLTNMSTRAVETSRYRIKKKLGIEKGQGFYSFLKDI